MRALISLPFLLGCAPVPQTASPEPQASRYEHRPPTPDGTGIFYQGREIANYMSHVAALWLDRPEREAEEGVSRLIRLLDLKPGQVVADVGAGSGTLSIPMARLVGPKGRVLAVDIQPEMLDLVRKKAARASLKNVEPVLGKSDDPKLPKGEADLILLVDVYHELDRPYEMTERMIEALKPGGRLVLVEYRGEDEAVPIKPLHKMTERQILKEMALFPELAHDRTISELPRQHVVVMRKR